MNDRISSASEWRECQVTSERGKIHLLDFASLNIPAELQDALRRAFVGCYGHTAESTRRQVFQTIRRFCQFLEEMGLYKNTPLPPNVVSEFRNWLAENYISPEKKSSSVAVMTFNAMIVLLKWCERNTSQILAKRTNFIVSRFERVIPKESESLEEDTVKAILKACYEDIELTIAAHAYRERLREAKDLSQSELKLARVLRQLLALRGNGEVPTTQEIATRYQRYHSHIEKLGGMRKINRMLWITPETLLPFFLAILLQSSGNPTSILNLERDCIVRHPLREDIEILQWMKIRSRRFQRIDFPVGKEWSAPSLVRKLSRLNQNILVHCSKNDENKLFLCRSGRGSDQFGRISTANLSANLRLFIQKHKLPHFTFKQLRRSGAVLHHRAGKTLDAAKRRLNHRSFSTTLLYTKQSDLAGQHENLIRRFQGAIVDACRGGIPGGTSSLTAAPTVNAAPAETVFGFQCKDPFAGTAPGSVPGKPCLQFSGCATCPGALITLDDVEVVKRLFSSLMALNKAAARASRDGWWPRFAALYEPTRQIIERELLPAVDSQVLELAKKRIPSDSFLWLE